MRAFAPDVYYVSDDPTSRVDLPRCEIAFTDSKDDAQRFDVPVVPADRPVACVFTSGSTGEPQPHFKAWGSLVRDMAAGCARMGVGPGHAVLGTVPPQHMYGFESTVMLPLLSGAALTSERPYYPADIDQAISRVPPQRTLYTTPFHLRNWLAQGEAAHVETIVSATAPLPVSLALEAERLTGARVFEIYGCTEAGQVATRRPTCSEEWQALEGVRLWNQDGQAMVEGGHIDEPTPLQDVIDVSPNGTHFTLGGRTGDMVNIAGKRNSLGYLNHHLSTIPGVVDGVFFLPDDPVPGRVTRLTAFVVAPGLMASDITAGLRERIDPAFLPRPVVMLDRLPREATGKITRDALKALATKSPARGDS
jgi:acyl-coenzyme A synthetase/AMP-(fatty) acid ligase